MWELLASTYYLVGGDWFEDETTLTEGEVEDREKSGDETSSASAKATYVYM